MPRPPADTPHNREQVRELHAKGLSRNAIAREIGVSDGSVTKMATSMGLSFDRSQTIAGTEARQADLKQRKTDACEREMQILEYEQERIIATITGRAGFKTILKGTGGAERVGEVDFVPPAQARELAQARYAIQNTIAKLAPTEDDKDNGAIDRWLLHITGGNVHATVTEAPVSDQ